MELTPIVANPGPPVAPAERPPSGLGWLLSGFVLPLGSRTFYRLALRKSAGLAVLFFLLFSCAITSVTTLVVSNATREIAPEIERVYRDGSMPDITIANGIAQVEGPQPIVFYDDPYPGSGLLMAIDTTGQVREIDRSLYSQAVLLTREELHTLNERGEYQVIALADLNSMFQTDPIILDRDTVGALWNQISAIAIIGTALGVFFWHFVLGLMLVALLGLMLWGITALIRPGTQFGPILAAGLYAAVPAFYLAHVLGRSGVAFPGLQTLLLIPIWALALVLGLSELIPMREGPPGLWTALLGIPLLVVGVVELFVEIPDRVAAVALLWVALLGTIILIVGARFLVLRRDAASTPAA